MPFLCLAIIPLTGDCLRTQSDDSWICHILRKPSVNSIYFYSADIIHSKIRFLSLFLLWKTNNPDKKSLKPGLQQSIGYCNFDDIWCSSAWSRFDSTLFNSMFRKAFRKLMASDSLGKIWPYNSDHDHNICHFSTYKATTFAETTSKMLSRQWMHIIPVVASLVLLRLNSVGYVFNKNSLLFRNADEDGSYLVASQVMAKLLVYQDCVSVATSVKMLTPMVRNSYLSLVYWQSFKGRSLNLYFLILGFQCKATCGSLMGTVLEAGRMRANFSARCQQRDGCSLSFYYTLLWQSVFQ